MNDQWPKNCQSCSLSSAVIVIMNNRVTKDLPVAAFENNQKFKNNKGMQHAVKK